MVAVELSAELTEFVDREIANGRYQSREQLIADAVQRLQEQSQYEADLRAKIQVGLDELERGEGISIRGDGELRQFFDDIKSECRARHDAKLAEQAEG